MYIFELRSPKKRKMKAKYLERRGFTNPKQVKTGKYAFHFEVEVDDSDLKKTIRRCKRRKLSYFYYDKQFARATNYRRRFFDAYNPPYRCQYCHKKLNENTVIVDHLIPVNLAKKSPKVQRLIINSGLDGVNDVMNLVPSCPKCNLKKGNKMGIWYIRGKLGYSRLYWFIHGLVRLVFAAAILLLLASVLNFLLNI